VSAENTLIVNNTGGNCQVELQGALIDDGFNMQFPGTDCGATIIAADPGLGALTYNGGPTPTFALPDGSPAIDTGDPTYTPSPDYDQRGPGFPRVYNGRIDIGAFELSHNFVVNATADSPDNNAGDGLCETAIPGECTLRAAIEEANATPGENTINFSNAIELQKLAYIHRH